MVGSIGALLGVVFRMDPVGAENGGCFDLFGGGGMLGRGVYMLVSGKETGMLFLEVWMSSKSSITIS